MSLMPTIPESAKVSLAQRLRTHAAASWSQLTTVHVRYRGQFAYVDGELAGGERQPLMRLRYGGSAHRWGNGNLRGEHEQLRKPDLVHQHHRGGLRPGLRSARTQHRPLTADARDNPGCQPRRAYGADH
jgi:hypothetical protein